MRAVCLLLLFSISISVQADPPSAKKGKARKEAAPAVEIPAGLVDPKFRSEFEKADPYIRAIITEHERQFPGAMGYNYLNFYAQLNRLSYIQQGLVYELMQAPGYLEAFTGREPMTDIQVTVIKGEDSAARKFDDKVWKGFLAYVLRSVDDAAGELKARKEELTPAGVLVRLRKNFYRAWNQAYYPEESDRVRDQLIPFIVFATVAQRNPDAGVGEIKDLIAKLEVGALDYFQDKASWEPLFEGVAAKIRFEKDRFPEFLDEAMDRTYKVLGKKVYGERREIQLRKGDVITIREVHPDIAMFRGYVGNDCATCFSPGFVFNPMDRYYYVAGADGKTLGYVGTTFVTVSGKKATLIHTIQGPGFDEATTQMVMRGFQAAQGALGVKMTVLSGDRNIFENVNYYPIQESMMRAVAGHKELPMKFADMQFREIIAKWDSEMTYDDPKANPFAREIKFKPEDVSVEVTQTPFDFKMSISSPEAIEAAEKSCSLRMTWKKSGSDSSDGIWGWEW